ncbi:hypothetical protein AGMMS49587_08160 [Spirochaetia bacterium]|nr:hypothetical protein AGMMS49587_08160 [Spirochaetia bacterium]
MRTLEDIENDLAAARETLSSVEGTPAEVYSRIVGYYRSVRNWNRGKREEYGERRLYDAAASMSRLEEQGRGTAAGNSNAVSAAEPASQAERSSARLILFVRPACPACPSAKEAAGRLGIPVDLVNADTEVGLAEAARRNVLSTPTAILLSARGEELDRARDPGAIASFKSRLAS